MKTIRRYAALALVLALASCAGAPEASAAAPAWAATPPPPDATSTYFVGYAVDTSGDAVKAAEDAARSLTAEIVKYIGVTVTAESSATAKGSIDAIETALVSTVRTKTEATRMAGFSIADRYEYRDGKKVYVYILGKYLTKDLEAEKARIAALFKERDDSVTVPESDSVKLAAGGRQFEAVIRALDAAMAATKPEIVNAPVKFQRNIDRARELLIKLRVVPLASSVLATSGEGYSLAFKVAFGEGDSAPGVKGAALALAYPVKMPSGSMSSKVLYAKTGDDGVASFEVPSPNFAGKAKATVRLDFASTLTALDALPAAYAAQASAVAEEIAKKTAAVEVSVGSAAKAFSVGVAIADIDASGAAIAPTSAGALAEALSKAGFKAKPLSVPKDAIASGDEEAALAAARAAKVQRLVLGTVTVLSVEKDGRNYIAKVSASVRVIDVATGDSLYGVEKSATGLGSSEAIAIKEAFKAAGAKFLFGDLSVNMP